MNDLISRQAAIEALAENMPHMYTPDGSHPADEGIFMAQEIYADCIQTLKELPSVQPGLDEWCTDCKEYDQEKHCCPRWNRVIRQTVEDVKKQIPDTTRILAEVLNGSPLLYPCDKLWSREGWCKEYCKKGQTEPDTECWLKYAETIAAERRDE